MIQSIILQAAPSQFSNLALIVLIAAISIVAYMIGNRRRKR